MPAFTAFLLGSGQRHPKTANINSNFFDACKQDGNPKSCMILDGPQKLGGAYDPKKIRENVETTVANIKAWLKTATPDANGKYQINLTGFSRGAVTCLKIANALQEIETFEGPNGKVIRREDLSVNIFAEDPVSGFGDKADKTTKDIPPIVKTFVATYQMDERRRGFKPQDLSRLIYDPAKTNVVVLPMPGNHSAINKVKDKMKEGALIHWNLKYQFLRQQGTEFREEKLPDFAGEGTTLEEEKSLASPTQLLEYYGQLKNNQHRYLAKAHAFHAADIPLPGVERTFNRHLKDYVSDDFFINQHERELFKKAYHKVFNYLFENGRLDENDPHNTGGRRQDGGAYGYANEELNHEIIQLRQHNPLLFERLKKADLVAFDQGIKLPNTPRGFSRIEDCKLLDGVIAGKPVTHNPLSLLDEEVRVAVYRYLRGKPSYMAMSERSEAERAHQIREELRFVRNNNEPDDQKKYQDALNRLEKHLIELKSYDSSSQLAKSLEEILKRHGRSCEVTTHPSTRNDIIANAGRNIQTTGRIMQRGTRVLSAIVGGIGKGVSDFGKRLIERATSVRNPVLRVGASILGYIVGGACVIAGEIVKGVVKGIDWAAGKVKQSGDKLIQSSRLYQVAIVKKSATLPASVTFAKKTTAPLVSSDHHAHKTAEISGLLHIDAKSLVDTATPPQPTEHKEKPVESVSRSIENEPLLTPQSVSSQEEEETKGPHP